MKIGLKGRGGGEIEKGWIGGGGSGFGGLGKGGLKNKFNFVVGFSLVVKGRFEEIKITFLINTDQIGVGAANGNFLVLVA